MRNYVLFYLLLAIPWGFVKAQEITCEIIDFSGEIPLEVEQCDDEEFDTGFYETRYDEEEDSPPELRENSQGLLAASGPRSCIIFPHELMLDEFSGIFIPIYYEQFQDRDMIIITFVDMSNPDNKMSLSPTLRSQTEWNKEPLEGIFLDSPAVLPGNKFKLTISTATEGNGRLFIDFVQIINSNSDETECRPREIPDPELPTDPPEETEPTDPTTPTEETETTDLTTPTEETEPTDPTTPTEETEPTDPTTPTEETESTDPTTPTEEPPTESPTTEEPTVPDPEETEPEWKVVAAVFISLFCGACVLILLLIFKPFLTKATTASSGLVTNEHPMARTTLPRLQVESGSGISGVNRESEATWP